MKATVLMFLMWFGASASSVTLTGVNGENDGQYYVLPYQLSIDGHQYEAACYDFFDHVSIGETWEAEIRTVEQAASAGRFSAVPGALNKYHEVAILFSLYPGPDQVELQHAIWDVFDPGQFIVTTVMQGYLDAAGGLRAGFDYSKFRFVESVAGNIQTFVIDPVETPEPGTFASGMLGVLLIGMARKLQAAKIRAMLLRHPYLKEWIF